MDHHREVPVRWRARRRSRAAACVGRSVLDVVPVIVVRAHAVRRYDGLRVCAVINVAVGLVYVSRRTTSSLRLKRRQHAARVEFPATAVVTLHQCWW